MAMRFERAALPENPDLAVALARQTEMANNLRAADKQAKAQQQAGLMQSATGLGSAYMKANPGMFSKAGGDTAGMTQGLEAVGSSPGAAQAGADAYMAGELAAAETAVGAGEVAAAAELGGATAGTTAGALGGATAGTTAGALGGATAGIGGTAATTAAAAPAALAGAGGAGASAGLAAMGPVGWGALALMALGSMA